MEKTPAAQVQHDMALNVLEQFIQQTGADSAQASSPAPDFLPETAPIGICLIPDMDVGTGVPP